MRVAHLGRAAKAGRDSPERPTFMNDPNLESLVGRRIIGAILKEARQVGSNPSAQVFLILDDGTYAEVYAHVGGLCCSMAWPAGAAQARKHMDDRMDTVYEACS
jgi:hypothetical protein